MRKIGLILFSAIIACLTACAPTNSKIEKYGVEKFSSQCFAFLQTNVANQELINYFKPKEIKKYSAGVLLVFSESRKYIKGIYFDPENFDNLGGSGHETEKWYNKIGWISIKKREPAKNTFNNEMQSDRKILPVFHMHSFLPCYSAFTIACVSPSGR